MPPHIPEDMQSAWAERAAELAGCVTTALRELLEEKHLYQGVDVDFGDLVHKPVPATRQRVAELFQMQCNDAVKQPWHLVDNAPDFSSGGNKLRLRPRVPDVKLFCTESDRREPHNSVSAEDFLRRDDNRPDYENDGKTIQVFVLSFLCQCCKRVPEVVIVRREGNKLILSGRSPMEHTVVPSCIPKGVARHFQSAVLAYRCGQTLPGLFMLRTLIEQWARSRGHGEARACDAIDAYVSSLPDDFRSKWPCLRKEYEDLSVDIHAAVGSEKLFREVQQKIEIHFESRRLHAKLDPVAFSGT